MTRGTIYGSTLSSRLHPSLVRNHQFSSTGFGRRGLDPQEVRRFLHRIALELASLHRDLERLTDENIRIKRALRDWQSAQANRHQS